MTDDTPKRRPGWPRAGPGRRAKWPGGRGQQITLTLPVALVAALDEEAAAAGKSRSEVVVRRLGWPDAPQ